MHMTALDDAAWDSPWRGVRVGEKVLLCVGLLITAIVAPAWPASPIVAGVAVALALGPARIPGRALAIAAAAPLTFIVIGAVSVAVRVGEPAADAWWSWWLLSMDAASLAKAAEVCGHAIAGTLALLLLATTTPMVDLLGWFGRLGVPPALIDVASLTYRLLFVLLDVALGVRAAQVARLGRGGLREASQTMGTVLVRAWQRSTRLTEGLEARGLDGDLVALSTPRPRSAAFVTASLALLAAVWAITAWTVLA